MFANQRVAGAGWTRACFALAFAAATLGSSIATRMSVAAERDGGFFSGWKFFGAAEPRLRAAAAGDDDGPQRSAVRGQSESESAIGSAVSTVTESTTKAYRTVASGTSKAYKTVASGTSRAFRSTKETLLPWTASDAKATKPNPYRRELPPEKGEVIVKHWYEFWKPDPEEPPKPKTVQDFLNQPRLE